MIMFIKIIIIIMIIIIKIIQALIIQIVLVSFILKHSLNSLTIMLISQNSLFNEM